ncbi:MAG: hypothetical protein D6756_10330 [Cyanobacteria bacterium J083]|nr:MAG: hypothetical protein D6756_10330 [Cyanobacteria bacterium J083]
MSSHFRVIAFQLKKISFNFSVGILISLACLVALKPLSAQNLRPEIVAEKVYAQFPDLPQENNYISLETGKTASDNTLIARLVRYHQYVKSRPTRFRLDWQLTLADYLGYNEPVIEARYPGSTTLKNNPLSGDRAAIDSLSRRQRRELIDFLVSFYNATSGRNYQKPESQPTSNNNTKPQTNPPTKPPKLPSSGAADLLTP